MGRVGGAFNRDVPAIGPAPRSGDGGYPRLGDFLAKGEIVPREFDKAQLLASVCRCQGRDPDRPFENAEAAATALLGLRSDFAARLRVREFTPLERLHRRGTFSSGLGIPDFVTYCTESDLMLFKRAKDVALTKETRAVLRVVRENEPISRPRLLAMSSLGYTGTTRALKALYEGCHVTRAADNRYRTVRDLRIPVEQARKAVLRRGAESLGVFSAEALANFLRVEVNMAETRRLLRGLRREGRLVKGV